MGGSRRGDGVWTPLKNHKNIEFLSNTGPDPLKNHKTTKPVFNVGPSSAHQRNTIYWRFTGGPMMARFKWYFGSIVPSRTKKKKKKTGQNWTPSDKTFWIRFSETVHFISRNSLCRTDNCKHSKIQTIFDNYTYGADCINSASAFII